MTVEFMQKKITFGRLFNFVKSFTFFTFSQKTKPRMVFFGLNFIRKPHQLIKTNTETKSRFSGTKLWAPKAEWERERERLGAKFASSPKSWISRCPKIVLVTWRLEKLTKLKIEESCFETKSFKNGRHRFVSKENRWR